MKYVLLALLLCSWFTGSACAQPAEESLVRLDISHSHSAYPAGAAYSLALSISIQPGFHINSTTPDAPELIPTRLTLNAAQGIALTDYRVPQTQYHMMPGETEPWKVWSGNISFEPIISIAPEVRPGSYELLFTLSYQACDDQICQMPAAREIKAIIEVTSAQ